MKYFLTAFLLFFFTACGYRPISKVANSVLDDRIYVDVIISKTEPKNSVLIKDAVKEGVVSRLNRSLSDKKHANTFINASISSLSYEATVYDEYGYVSSYKAVLRLNFKTKFKDGKVIDIPCTGEYDFSVSRRIKDTRYADSILSDTERFEAIREASKEAFDEYISILAIKGYKHDSN
ncbi:MAG: penicillin-binding protein [Campylobacter sp.]|nr:penicillin-binding protein [Campylobacter sp.]